MTYRNINWTKRNYECTNVVACVGDKPANGDWAECDDNILIGLTKLHTIAGTTYYGYM